MESLIEVFGNQWLANARRLTRSSTDADDVFQLAMEALITTAPDLAGEELAAWVHAVIRNQAASLYRRRSRDANLDFEAIVSSLESEDSRPEDRLLETEEFSQRKQAMRRLRVDHARCLLLRADGLNYDEICAITGFSYAKVNRCLSEGRKAVRVHLGSVESGADCDRYLPILSLIADREASTEQRLEVDLHLAHCLHCQATVRDFVATPERVRSVFPLAPALLAGATEHLRAAIDHLHAWTSEKIANAGSVIHQGSEFSTAKRAGATLVAALSIVGGAATIHESTGGDHQRAPAHQRATAKTSDSAASPAAQDDAESGSRGDRRSSRRNVRDASERDILGKNAGRSVSKSRSSDAIDAKSVPDSGAFNAPDSAGPEQQPAPASSSETYSDLAP